MKNIPFSFRREVEKRISRQHWLIPIYNDVLDIAKRIYEYDDTFFVAYNSRTKQFEVHNVEQPFNTYCISVGKKLTNDALVDLWKADVRMQGNRILQEIDEHNAKLEKQKEKEHSDLIKDFAKETRTLFAEDAWT